MIQMKKTLLLALLLGSLGGAHAQKTTVASPDKNVVLTTQLAANGTVSYSVSYKKTTFVEPSTLGFSLSRPKTMLTQFSLVSIDSATMDETWKPVWGEVNQIRNHYKALTLTLKDKAGIVVKVAFRVFNEGVGFRYEFPKQESSITLWWPTN